MVKFLELENEDLEGKYKDILEVIKERGITGICFLMLVNEKERIVQISNKLISVYSLNNDKKVEVYEYLLNEDYKITNAAFTDYEYIGNEDNYYFENAQNGNGEFITFTPVTEKEGVVTYTQYNYETDTSLSIYYKHNVAPKMFLYNFKLKEPDHFYIEKNVSRFHLAKYIGSKKGYSKVEINKDELLYDYVASKDERKTGYSNDNNLVRYYRIINIIGQRIYTTFPLGKQYSINDVQKMVEKLGFNLRIPDLLINFYNNTDPQLIEMNEITTLLKQMDILNNISDILDDKSYQRQK